MFSVYKWNHVKHYPGLFKNGTIVYSCLKRDIHGHRSFRDVCKTARRFTPMLIWLDFLFDESLEGYKLVYTVFHIGLIYESSLCANYFFIGLCLMGQNLIEDITLYCLRHFLTTFFSRFYCYFQTLTGLVVSVDILQYLLCIKGFHREILLDLPWVRHILAHSSQLLLIPPKGINKKSFLFWQHLEQ